MTRKTADRIGVNLAKWSDAYGSKATAFSSHQKHSSGRRMLKAGGVIGLRRAGEVDRETAHRNYMAGARAWSSIRLLKTTAVLDARNMERGDALCLAWCLDAMGVYNDQLVGALRRLRLQVLAWYEKHPLEILAQEAP